MSVVIEALPDGPLKVKGDFEVVKSDGTVLRTQQTAFLCGCGRSTRKPLCCGKHRRKAAAPE